MFIVEAESDAVCCLKVNAYDAVRKVTCWRALISEGEGVMKKRLKIVLTEKGVFKLWRLTLLNTPETYSTSPKSCKGL